jgi:hypothetical protein
MPKLPIFTTTITGTDAKGTAVAVCAAGNEFFVRLDDGQWSPIDNGHVRFTLGGYQAAFFPSAHAPRTVFAALRVEVEMILAEANLNSEEEDEFDKYRAGGEIPELVEPNEAYDRAEAAYEEERDDYHLRAFENAAFVMNGAVDEVVLNWKESVAEQTMAAAVEVEEEIDDEKVLQAVQDAQAVEADE